jgi:site-specific recombinase XerD
VRLKAGGALARNLRDLYARAGVPRETGDLWHRLRHAFATGLCAAGADLATIGAAMGHAPGSPVTLRYVHPDIAQLRAAVEALDARSRGTEGRGSGS